MCHQLSYQPAGPLPQRLGAQGDTAAPGGSKDTAAAAMQCQRQCQQFKQQDVPAVAGSRQAHS